MAQCDICNKEIGEGEGWHRDCYLEISAAIAELAGVNYDIENCVKTKTDYERLTELDNLTATLKDQIDQALKELRR